MASPGFGLRILKSSPFDEFLVQGPTVEHDRFPMREEIRTSLGLGYRRVAAPTIDDRHVRPLGRPRHHDLTARVIAAALAVPSDGTKPFRWVKNADEILARTRSRVVRDQRD